MVRVVLREVFDGVFGIDSLKQIQKKFRKNLAD